MPDLPTSPEVPCEKPFEKAPSNVCHGHLPARLTVLLYASQSGPGEEGILPCSAASGGYRGRGKPFTLTIGPPGYGFSYHSVMPVPSNHRESAQRRRWSRAWARTTPCPCTTGRGCSSRASHPNRPRCSCPLLRCWRFASPAVPTAYNCNTARLRDG